MHFPTSLVVCKARPWQALGVHPPSLLAPSPYRPSSSADAKHAARAASTDEPDTTRSAAPATSLLISLPSSSTPLHSSLSLRFAHSWSTLFFYLSLVTY